MKDIINSTTIATHSFGIDLQGEFETASFRGPKLGSAAVPAPSLANIPGFNR